MAITEDVSTPLPVTGSDAGSTTPTTKTITSASFSPPARSLLVALVGGGWGNGAAMAATVTDSAGGTWTAAVSAVGTSTAARGVAAVFYQYLSSAPGAITVTTSITNTCAGRFLAVRVLNGAASSQASSGTGTLVGLVGTTNPTVSVTTTVAGSVVYGVIDDCGTNLAPTPNAQTVFLPNGNFNDVIDSIDIVAWKSAAATGVTGATTFGGTYPSANKTNIAALEIVPAVITAVTAVTAAGTGVASNAITSVSSNHPAAASASAVGTANGATGLLPIVPSFPAVPRDADVELFVNNGWTDVTTDVRNSIGIDITRGRPNEASASQPSTCAMVFDNRSGNYSPRNPNGVYFGQIGRNTPIRVAVGLATDTFVRSAANDWGRMDTGQIWRGFSSGTYTPSDFQVTGGVGTHSVSAAGGFRYTYTQNTDWADVDLSVTFTLPFTTVTGGSIYPGSLILRRRSDNDYFAVFPMIQPSGQILIGLVDSTGPNVNTVFVDSGIIHSSSQPIRVRAQIERNTLRGKLWRASGPEPYAWQVVDNVGFAQFYSGAVGVYSGTQASNTNTYPLVVSYSNFKVRSARFFGEVTTWPQHWDTTGTDTIAPIEAAGISRRLGQGQFPQQSTLYKSQANQTPAAKAYWSCEDGVDSAFISSNIGGPNMTVQSTVSLSTPPTTKFAAYSGFASSAPIPTVGTNTTWVGAVPPYTNTNAATLSFITRLGATTIVDTGIIATLVMEGTANRWQIRYRSSTGPPVLVGDLSVTVQQNGVGQIYDSGITAFNANDQDILITLALNQNGTGVTYTLSVLPVGSYSDTRDSFTVPSCTIQRAVQVMIGEQGQAADTPIGHISVVDYVQDDFSIRSINAYRGETAGTRLARLCSQISVPFSFVGNLNTTAAVGAQHVDTALNIISEAADADLGTLTEPRGDIGFLYRTRTSTYLQNSSASISYAGGQVAAPFEPVDDDQLTRNNVAVVRRDGTTATAELLSGRMSVVDPALGGVGNYSTSTTINIATDDQLPDVAGWLLNLGTVDLARYPKVRVDLASPQVVADATLTARILDLSIDDRFLITNPKPGQSADSIDLLVRGYSEHISNFEHYIVFNAAPAAPYSTVVLDIADAKLDSAGSVLAAAATSVATTLSVATTTGPLWTTTALPLHITIGGEQMTVTAVIGTSSPQTFTVTRSTNGIIKAQAAGAVVKLYRPGILAL